MTDVTRPEIIRLNKSPGQGPVHGLTVTGSGDIKGSAEISLLLNGEPYKTEVLSGTAGFRWVGDWYSDQAEIRYEPSSVEGGSLKLRYRFED